MSLSINDGNKRFTAICVVTVDFCSIADLKEWERMAISIILFQLTEDFERKKLM